MLTRELLRRIFLPQQSQKLLYRNVLLTIFMMPEFLESIQIFMRIIV